MMKNIFLLFCLVWVSFTYAKPTIVKETMTDAHSYKWEKSHKEPEVKRSLAGGKTKKHAGWVEPKKVDSADEPDSEVRYWQYSE